MFNRFILKSSDKNQSQLQHLKCSERAFPLTGKEFFSTSSSDHFRDKRRKKNQLEQREMSEFEFAFKFSE